MIRIAPQVEGTQRPGIYWKVRYIRMPAATKHINKLLPMIEISEDPLCIHSYCLQKLTQLWFTGSPNQTGLKSLLIKIQHRYNLNWTKIGAYQNCKMQLKSLSSNACNWGKNPICTPLRGSDGTRSSSFPKWSLPYSIYRKHLNQWFSSFESAYPIAPSREVADISLLKGLSMEWTERPVPCCCIYTYYTNTL